MFTLAGDAVSWKTSLQDTVALSSTEEEYMALIFVVKEEIWLRGLLSDLGLEQKSVTIHCDNQGAIHLAYNPIYHERIKHINIRYHFIRNVTAKGKIVVKKIVTAENLVDMITKPIPLAKLELC